MKNNLLSFAKMTSKGIVNIILFFFLYLFVSFPLTFISEASQMQPLKNHRIYFMIAYFILYALIIGGMYWFFTRISKNKYHLMSWRQFGIAVLAYFFSRFIVIVLSVIKIMVEGSQNIESANDHALDIISSGMPAEFMLLFTLTVILFGPIAEELLFRGIFMNLFFQKHPYVSAIISGLIFGSSHLTTSWIDFLMYSSMGIVLGLEYAYTKNMTVNTMIHILNNSIATFLPYLLK